MKFSWLVISVLIWRRPTPVSPDMEAITVRKPA